MKVRFYGRLADLIGAELEVEAPPNCSVAEIRDCVAATHPQAAEVLRSRRASACVRDRLVRDDHILVTGEIVEFLPPVSGG